uniref:CHCH domain-containing protein n=1 Tax=viral metagenome TaxID=1070528 RepID=A0A6C0LJ99_9ZZZZ
MENQKSESVKKDCREFERLYIKCIDKEPAILDETCSKQFDYYIECNKTNVVQQTYKK